MGYIYDEDYLVFATNLEKDDAIFHFSSRFPSKSDVSKEEIEKLIDDLVEFKLCRRNLKRAGRVVLQKPHFSGERKPYSVMLDNTAVEYIEHRRGRMSRSDYIESCVDYVESLYGPEAASIADLYDTRDQKAGGK
jgi:hypothetical protein